jgi:hypothetical protein
MSFGVSEERNYFREKESVLVVESWIIAALRQLL